MSEARVRWLGVVLGGCILAVLVPNAAAMLWAPWQAIQFPSADPEVANGRLRMVFPINDAVLVLVHALTALGAIRAAIAAARERDASPWPSRGHDLLAMSAIALVLFQIVKLAARHAELDVTPIVWLRTWAGLVVAAGVPTLLVEAPRARTAAICGLALVLAVHVVDALPLGGLGPAVLTIVLCLAGWIATGIAVHRARPERHAPPIAATFE